MGKGIFYKTFLPIATVLILLFGGLFVSAENYGEFSLDIPDGFSVADSKADKTEISQITGMSVSDIENYFIDNNLLLLAVDKNNAVQIKLSFVADDFTSKTGDFSKFDDKQLLSIGESLFDKEELSNTNILKSNGHKFIAITGAHKDSGGIYIATQYITVVNGKKYTLSVFVPENYQSDFNNDVLKSFKIVTEKHSNSYFYDVVIVVLIVAFSAVIVITVIGIIKTQKKDISEDN